MAGKKVIPDLTEAEVYACMEARAVAMAEVRKLDLMIKQYANTHGGFSHAGLSVYCTQSIRETYALSLIADALTELAVPYKELLNFMSPAAINKLVRASEYGADIRAILKQAPNEGMIIVYGKPLMAVRTKPPDESKVHVLNPGDKPLEMELPEMEENDFGGDEEDEAEYTEAPLSPGD